MIKTNIIKLNKGSDLRFEVHWTDAQGPIDLTGATVEVFEQHEALGAVITVTDAAQGKAQVVAEFNDAWPMGTELFFRLRVTSQGVRKSDELIWVDIK